MPSPFVYLLRRRTIGVTPLNVVAIGNATSGVWTSILCGSPVASKSITCVYEQPYIPLT
jgi:Na+/glutamate symporter